MTITYRPKGVCSRLMRVEVENGIIRKVANKILIDKAQNIIVLFSICWNILD